MGRLGDVHLADMLVASQAGDGAGYLDLWDAVVGAGREDEPAGGQF